MQTDETIETPAKIAFVGGGPAALTAAIALARRGIRTTFFERDAHPEVAPRFNPERSYAIDITGHGLKALRHIDACPYFDQRMLQFKGIKLGREAGEWNLPGWIGSRGDIVRTLIALVEEQYSEWISCEFECRVTSVDVLTGSLTYESQSKGALTEQFDFIIGSDGTGSAVRKAMLEQIPEFTAKTQSFPIYCTMLELDRKLDQWDKNYLYDLSVMPVFSFAGAITGGQGSDTARWFCAVGTDAPLEFSSAQAAQQFLGDRLPQILELTSEEQIAAFAKRASRHIGQTLTCSQLYGGKAVLLGDAAAAFPPIGQGVNAAMESAMTLDLSIGEAGNSPTQLLEAAILYNTRWKPEVDAVSWIAIKGLIEEDDESTTGLNALNQAKSAEISYSEVRREAERL
ncbi:FAD-dependent oxidoreductase [Nostoc sp.]|uniref:FAD-dependent oxidoreductase n=1 Tax=Nostoc sp. TaxID=1180 RepID=UPI002FF953EF